MTFVTAAAFTSENAWGAKTIATMNGISTRLHWTDKAYRWHVNDGEEVFVVLDGKVIMHYEKDGQPCSYDMQVGDIFHATIGTKHRAEPIGEARVLVIEKANSI